MPAQRLEMVERGIDMAKEHLPVALIDSESAVGQLHLASDVVQRAAGRRTQKIDQQLFFHGARRLRRGAARTVTVTTGMYPKLDVDPFCEQLQRVGRRCASNGIGRKLRRTSPNTPSLSKKRRRPSVIPCQQPAWIPITPSTRSGSYRLGFRHRAVR